MRLFNSHALAGLRLGILGKGGSGKSTLTVILAKCLRAKGYDVVVLDADSTNVGLHWGFGIPRAPEPLINWFGGDVFSGGPVTCPVDDPSPLSNPEILMSDLPAQYQATNDEGITLLEAGKVIDRGPGAGCDGPVAKIARDLWIRAHGRNPVMIIDFKAGLEDSARGVLTNLDWGVVVVEPTAAAIELAASLDQLCREIQSGQKPATAHFRSETLVRLAELQYARSRLLGIAVILNRVDNDSLASHLTDRLARRGLLPMATIPADQEIALAWLRMQPINGLRFAPHLESAIRRLESETIRQAPRHRKFQVKDEPS